MEEEKFSAKTLFTGGGKKTWYKTLGYGWRLLAIVLFCLLVYRAFFMRTTSVKVGKGGTANIYNAPKRFLIPFIEGGVEQRTQNNLNTYIRAGLRFEF